MTAHDEFIRMMQAEFPQDRLTYQKSVATFHTESADEAARLFRLANTHRQQLYITGFGNNIDPAGEPFVGMVSVRTDRLNALLEVAPADFYVRVGSGYPLREINEHLKTANLWLPHAGLPYVGSVGGAVAAGLSAELDGHDFPLKKYFIRAEVVTPEGEIINPGSVCFKSVSGYDIAKVFFNSWGLLGLIVSATFRVMPSSAAEEFAAMKMKAIDRSGFLLGLDPANISTEADYCRKIKANFDPNGVLPIV
jgi:FAD/FMN-containing dehydrogenase